MDQICPFEVVCWFSHDVRHLEFVSPEDTEFKVKKYRQAEETKGGEGLGTFNRSSLPIARFFLFYWYTHKRKETASLLTQVLSFF